MKIMHVDMDAFYVSVEMRRHPEIDPGAPVWVGGAQRGVVLSANYPARARGVRGGMPSTRARRLCPEGIALSPDHDTYAEVSRGVFAIFESVTPHVEHVSIDEAFCEISGTSRLFGTPRQLAEHVRALVADEQGITCTVGIGPSKLVAKMASNAAKPDGVKEVDPADVTAFLHPLPVDALWGVGEATATKLRHLGLETVGDLARTPKPTLQRAFGPHLGAQLADYAWGRDPRRVVVAEPERSIGSQETFPRDTDDPDVVTAEILRVTERVGRRVRAAQACARTVSLSLRFADFTTISRSVTLRTPTDSTDELYAAVMGLWRKLALQRVRIRRVGVRAEGLVDNDRVFQQFTLDEPERGWRDAERAADALVRRFGPRAVQRARLTRPGRREEGASESEAEVETSAHFFA